MSYDVSFRAKLEGIDQFVSVGEERNYTSNMSKAIAVASKQNKTIKDFNGMRTTDVLPILQTIIWEFIDKPQEYRQYEPSNGWGSIETCLEFLLWFNYQCEMYPTAIVEVW